MMTRRTVLWVIVAVLPSLFLAGPASSQRGVTDTEIRIGQWGPQTGPASLWGAVARGSGCYFDMINEQGGIHGRKITYFMRDDGYMPPRTKAIVKELVEDKEVFGFVGGVGTATGMAVKKYLHSREIPWVGPAAGSTHWAYPPTPYLYAVYTLYCDEADILISHAVEQLGKKRIAIFYQNDDYGKLARVGAELSLEKYDMELVAAVPVEIMDTDLSSHVNKLKAAKADCVLMFPNPKHGAVIVMTAAKMGFSPQWMATSTLGDIPIMYKITKGLFKDVIYVTFAELPGSSHPLMDRYKEAHARFAPRDRWGVFFYAGIAFAEPLVEGLKRAGRNLTTGTFVDGMDSLEGFQGIGPRLTYGPDRRQGTRSSFLVKVKEAARLERISGWITSDLEIQEVLHRMGR